MIPVKPQLQPAFCRHQGRGHSTSAPSLIAQLKVLQQPSNLAFDTEKFCHLERVVEPLGILPTKIRGWESVTAIWGLLYFLPLALSMWASEKMLES